VKPPWMMVWRQSATRNATHLFHSRERLLKGAFLQTVSSVLVHIGSGRKHGVGTLHAALQQWDNRLGVADIKNNRAR